MGGALQISEPPAADPAASAAAPIAPDPFEDYRRRGGMRCPHCRHIANRRSSQEVTPLFWDVYYVCSHPGCGHSWKAQLAYLYGLSPSAVPNPEFSDLLMRPMDRSDVVKAAPPPPEDPNQLRFFD